MKDVRFLAGLKILFGKDPVKPSPEKFSEEAKRIHASRWGTPEAKANFLRAQEEARKMAGQSTKWKRRRWITLILVNLFFVVSYKLDIQLLEGSLTGSRLLGFHMIDLNAALQLMLAHKHVIINLLIGTGTVLFIWILVGGRTFCSWVCPYHLLAEIAEKAHLYLVKKKIIKGVYFHRGARGILYVLFLVLSYATGYTIYETISPTGIVSRALIYGPGVALGWVGFLLLFEIFVSRRFWCRYVCPIGLTYGAVSAISPTRVTYKLDKCFHEGECRKVCMVPHVLDMVLRERATQTQMPVGPDCTRCGMCVDVCPGGALTFEVKGLSKLL